MMKRLALAIAALAAAPALAQQSTDWTKTVTSVDTPAAAVAQTIAHTVDLTPADSAEELARRWEREQANVARGLPLPMPVVAVTAEDLGATPLPPPCEPPLPVAPTEPPGPPQPAPAPCRP
jgi:hypothetical protein